MKKGQKSFVTCYRSKTQETDSDVHTGLLASTPSDNHLVRWGAAGFCRARTDSCCKALQALGSWVRPPSRRGDPGQGRLWHREASSPAGERGPGATLHFHHKCPPPQVSPLETHSERYTSTEYIPKTLNIL